MRTDYAVLVRAVADTLDECSSDGLTLAQAAPEVMPGLGNAFQDRQLFRGLTQAKGGWVISLGMKRLCSIQPAA